MFVVYFSGHKAHISIACYPTERLYESLHRELQPYKKSKSAFQLPHQQPLPIELLRAVAIFKVNDNGDQGRNRTLNGRRPANGSWPQLLLRQDGSKSASPRPKRVAMRTTWDSSRPRRRVGGEEACRAGQDQRPLLRTRRPCMELPHGRLVGLEPVELGILGQQCMTEGCDGL